MVFVTDFTKSRMTNLAMFGKTIDFVAFAKQATSTLIFWAMSFVMHNKTINSIFIEEIIPD